MNTLITLVAGSTLILNAHGMTSSSSSSGASLSFVEHASERLKVGDTIEDFTIPTAFSPDDSTEVTLTTLLESGPVVLTFFRGSWCPYCKSELSDIQDRIEDFQEYGATVLAVSPEVDSRSVELGKELGLEFFVAHDENNAFARSLGLTFKLDAKTIKKYREYGINVGDSNGTGTWELPVPATYVIDQDRTIRFVFDDEDYSKRANYKEVLKVVKEITSED
jgi:peroxiredoxin